MEVNREGTLTNKIHDGIGSNLDSYKVVGEQLIVELYGCDPLKIDDLAHVEKVMLHAAKAANTTVVAHKFHKFSPQGVSGAVIVAESHLAIHTWPEDNYCTVDIFTCGPHTDNAAAVKVIKMGLGATDDQVVEVKMRKVNEPTNIANVAAYKTKRELRVTPAQKTQEDLAHGKTWGVLSSVDLTNCNPATIRSAEKIKKYVVRLCDLIEMKRFGECQVVHFGEDEKVAGYSMIQLIETSCISGHFANQTNNAYIDIFSCKAYDAEKVVAFTKKFFEADHCEITVLPRGTHKKKGDHISYQKDQDLVFQENYAAFGGMRASISIKELLESYSSQWQKLEVYDTVPFGKMLVLDGIVMLTEYDNYAYHEMIAHVPLIAHPNPHKVLIVGGGDGGTLKEVLKHDSVQEVVLCEIDKEVINVSKRHFPDLTSGFNDPRMQVVIQDAAAYIKTKQNYFDVICVDSTDFFGIADVLFRAEFYQNMHTALSDDGIAVTQSESMYYDKDFIAKLYKQNKEIFAHASYYYTLVPTYPSGTIGFSYCSKKYNPATNMNAERIAKLGKLSYYNEAIHHACFQLPQTVKNALGL